MAEPSFIMGKTVIGTAEQQQFRLIRSIGKGVFEAVSLPEYKAYAIKLRERSDTTAGLLREQRVQAAVVSHIRGSEGATFVGIPAVQWAGTFKDWDVLATEFVGEDLDCKLEKRGGPFPRGLLYRIATLLITIIEAVHKAGFVYGNLEPKHVAAGVDGENKDCLYLLNFSRAVRWANPKTDKPDRSRNILFASIGAMKGSSLSWRDDLQSLVYMLLYLCDRLPWGDVVADGTKKQWKEVLQMKKNTPMDDIRDEFLPAMSSFMVYVFDLRSDEDPDYKKCRGFFSSVLANTTDQTLRWDLPTGPVATEEGKGKGKRSFEPVLGDPSARAPAPAAPAVPVPMQQHMVVTTMQPTDRDQRWLAATDWDTANAYISDQWRNPEMRVTTMNFNGPYFVVVVSTESGFKKQSMKYTTRMIPATWITKKANEGMFITAIGCRSGLAGCTVVLVSDSTGYTEQIVHESDVFPAQFIQDSWAERRFITSIATRDGKWLVVMSKHPHILAQCFEIDLCYPSARINGRWRDHYLIDNIAATSTQVAYIMTKKLWHRGRTDVVQHSHRTSCWCGDKVQADKADRMYVSAVAYGITGTISDN